MKSIFSFFLRHYFYWLLFFLAGRIAFLCYSMDLSGIAIPEMLHTLTAGFRLDVSAATYLVIIPFLLVLANVFGGDIILKRILTVYYFLVTIITVVFTFSNLVVYRNWGTLLNARALSYVLQPVEMLASVTGLQLLMMLLAFGIFFFIAWYLLRKFILAKFYLINGTTSRRLFTLLLIAPLLVIGIRGGLQHIPINESAAVFSAQRKLNDVAINNLWYLGHNLNQSNVNDINPYQFMENEKASLLTALLMKKDSESSQKIIQPVQKPNIVFILLESWTADIIAPLGGDENVTPFFTSLCKDGLLFNNIYSSGFRTDQALASIFSGFPAQPEKSIIRFPSKVSQLPSLASVLKNEGYVSGFYYGGDLGFSNMNNYLVSGGFDMITGIDQFMSNTHNSKWGAHDAYVLEYMLRELGTLKEPFFSSILTLSTHEPFEVPMETPFNEKNEPALFRKSAWYTDQCLADYFEAARKTSWYANTLFVLMADHGHRLPRNRDYFDPLSRKIPLLFYGEVLQDSLSGQQVATLGAQHDLAATLLNQLGYNSGDFKWSNDLLKKPRHNFAYLSQDNAFTWINDTGAYLLPLSKGIIASPVPPDVETTGRAYLQQLYQEFLAY